VGGKYILSTIQIRKALPGFFLCIFSSLTCLKKPVFSKRELMQWKVPASLSLFLKSEKIPALLYVGKGPEYRPFSYTNFPSSSHHCCPSREVGR
jgi:hypothetical protein